MASEALFARCPVCPKGCNLPEGRLGHCRARRNIGGTVVPQNYGRITSIALDPIEKKPLARYRPGSLVLSVGSYGCNLRCPFCQNASIAWAGQDDVPWRCVTPEELVSTAADLKDQGNIGIAYTYNEPLVSYEWIRDCGKLAHEQGLKNVLVSNGTINPQPLQEVLPLIDAANIDLKGFTDDFYGCVKGDLQSVKDTIRTMAQAPGCHLEVTTLVIPGMNDRPEEIDAAASWLASLDKSIPYHLTRFFPCHNLTDRPSTPVETVYALAETARKHLRHVYTGNC